MNLKAIEKMLSMIPDGPKKQAYLQKYQELKKVQKSKSKGGSGLQDTFEFKPKGHIKIEEIDGSGNVVGTLADQPNLVVDGAEEILLRAFSGDPNRILYKNRVPKVSPTNTIFIEDSVLANEGLFDGSQLLHAPNVLWSAVNDEDFEVAYAFYPVILYVKEVESTEFGKKAFVISNTATTGFVPLSSEIYSTYSNLFIGIGEGKYTKIDLKDKGLVYSEGFTSTENEAKTTTETHSVTFKGKISNFAIELEHSKNGAQVDVYVDNVLKETVETYDSGLVEGKVVLFEYGDLDNQKENTIRIEHSGGDVAVSTPEMTIKAIYHDALNKGMNGLMQEFKNFETEFSTPAVYNTTPMAPYTIQLPHFPVKENSVAISYNEAVFTQVAKETPLIDTTFHVDEDRGIVTFNRALSGVMATFAITGEIYDSELSTTMTSTDVSYEKEEEVVITNQPPTGSANGVNKSFTTVNKNLKESTVVIKKDGVQIQGDGISSINLETGVIILAVAPVNGSKMTVDYTYIKKTTISNSSMEYKTEFAIKEGSLKVLDHAGNLLELADSAKTFGNGKFLIIDEKNIKISSKSKDGSTITKVEVIYASDEKPGVPTGYSRAVIEKPKSVNEYPWFELDKGSVRFVAEFPDIIPSHNITIREMGLFDGPRIDDGIAGFRKYPVKTFSLVRVGETRKDTNTGIRITWTITLLNSDEKPFQGGLN